MKSKFIFAALVLCILANAAFSQSFDKAKLDQLFDTLAAKDKGMGSLAVAKDGEVIYSRAAGYSKIEAATKNAATAETHYRIGSISKTFTAVMIFQLIDEGKLKLTDTLDKFYPTVPNAEKITVSNLLNHRSGIHNFTSDADYASYEQKPQTQAALLDIFIKGKSDFAPGSKGEYSNPNYILLGWIIEKVDRKPYADALKERITAKINLSETYVGGKIGAKPGEAFSYAFRGEWKPATETDMSIPGGAGALVSTPSDLTKFIKALFDGKLISAASLKQMQTFTEGYGMGMFEYPVFGKKGFGHTGGIDGFRSMLVYLPEDKLAVAYITNGEIYPVKDIVAAAFAAALNQPVKIPSFETVSISEADLDKLTGVYSAPGFPLKITISRVKTSLFAQGTGQPTLPLEALAADKFKFEPAKLVLEFDASKNQMVLKQGGGEYILTKE